jgi:vacuolar-type H+-ATPase subunit E/Vma4
MTDTQQAKPSILRRGWGLLQWVISVLVLLSGAIVGLSNQGLFAPGAPATGFYISLAVLIAFAISLSPPVFFRLPMRGKIGSYIGLLIAFIVFANFNLEVTNAYKRTPEGAKWAAEQAAEERRRAEQDAAERAQQAQAERKEAEDQAALDGAKQALADLKGLTEQLEACKSWGEVPALSKLVQEGMNNPDSFEHVSTEFIVPTDKGQNVVMKFRGTNAYGGVVTNEVLARVEAETCEVSDVSQPE